MENLFTYMIILPSFFFCNENCKTHILCSITFLLKSCLLCDNAEKYGTAGQATDDNMVWRMRFACWVNKAIDTHSEYVIPIALSRCEWLRERAPGVTLYRVILSLEVPNYCL